MPKLHLQRVDPAAVGDKYKVYIDRNHATDIGFYKKETLDLPKGRYQLNIGGLRAQENQCWFDLQDEDLAFEIQSESVTGLKNILKPRQIVISKTEVQQLPEMEDLKRKKNKFYLTMFIHLLLNFPIAFTGLYVNYHLIINGHPEFVLPVAALVQISFFYFNIKIRRGRLYTRLN